ncbi:hypothetical protein FT643_22155 [Ketobacter sp. MCCC 1A13808]|uniref:hypothetical protein n=1 Tax=Ketobacter sp. MCCC 1A13808 TaxID=2602738 RepID=UPI0012EC078C|nr:hypothetical protein [Ketobacter sp. MCCC 1A13808]MVF14843.1 hypothetical protein [Ketobacter sp. MCCC 1A13808]
MSIEIAKIQKNGDRSFSIWINGDEGFDEQKFLQLIEILGISNNERIFASVGPAQFIDEVHTEHGIFNLSQEFDEFAGTTIYSESSELIESIFNIMVNSDQYHARK